MPRRFVLRKGVLDAYSDRMVARSFFLARDAGVHKSVYSKQRQRYFSGYRKLFR